MKVSVIIPNYNGEKLLEKNLPHLLKAKENKKNNILEIIVVDDGSVDQSEKFLTKNYPEIKLIKHTKNKGFSAAVNTGGRAAKGNFLLLINNDVVPEKDFLEVPLTHFDDEKVFAVSLHEKGYGWAKGKFENGYILHGPGKATNKAHDTFWVNGGSGLFRRGLWVKLGGMDEVLLSPFYWEDIDLGYRALKRGYRLVWEPKGLVHHKHETTIGRFSRSYVEKVRERNQLLFTWKNLTSPSLLRKHFVGLMKRALRNPGYFRIVFLAFLRLRKVIKARRKEIKEAKISDEAIFARFS